jgi:thiol-disulfide isomerase/thioredoxin
VVKNMRRWSIKKILKELTITLLMIFVVSIVLNYIRKPNSSTQIPNIRVKLINNQEIALKESGKPLVLHFWATWCPTCKLEAPNLESLKNDGIRVVTVAVNSGKSINEFMRERGYSYSVVNDSSGELAKKFGVEVYPTTFIYDSNGTLQFSEVGYSTTIGLKARVAFVEKSL